MPSPSSLHPHRDPYLHNNLIVTGVPTAAFNWLVTCNKVRKDALFIVTCGPDTSSGGESNNFFYNMLSTHDYNVVSQSSQVNLFDVQRFFREKFAALKKRIAEGEYRRIYFLSSEADSDIIRNTNYLNIRDDIAEFLAETLIDLDEG